MCVLSDKFIVAPNIHLAWLRCLSQKEAEQFREKNKQFSFLYNIFIYGIFGL